MANLDRINAGVAGVTLVARLLQRRRATASVSVVSIFSTALVAIALTNPGMTSTDVALNDSGVWVTRSQDNLAGRFNHEAEVLDGAVTAGTSSFDVLQQADAVLLFDTEVGTISPVDVAGLELTGSANVPPGASVGLGGQTVAILDPKSGSLWVLPVTGAASFSADSTEPVATLDQGAVLAVATDGTVHAASGDRLVTVETSDRGGAGEVTETTLDIAEPDDAELAITAVGADAVVLDRSTERLLLPGGSAVDVADAADVVLQQPGPATDAVVLATTSALLSQPLDGSKPRSLRGESSGEPVPPVYLDGCAYGAWTGSGEVVRDCAGERDDLVQNLGLTLAGARLQYRVNRDVVVLNELTSGSIWLADQDFELFDDWTDVLPSEDDQLDQPDATPDTSKDPLKERDKPNRPPVATNDSLGVRPGRTTILKVLDNDTDPDGDVLTADISDADPEAGTLQAIYGGAAVQLAVPADATGTSSFGYTADDGRGGADTATVNLTVRGWDQNEAPAALRETIVVVEQGKLATVNVLDDWLDPDGDDLLLLAATSTTDGDDVRSSPDGVVTFQDAGTSQGRKAVTLTISDGQGDPVEGTLWVDVRPTGQQPPATQPDHVTTTVGRPITVLPLRNDTDPNGDVLRLVRVDESAPGVITPDFEARSFSFVSDVARVYYLTYLVSDGPASTLGIVRIDVLPEPDGAQAPVAVRDTALLPAGGEVLVDVVANDVDPAGGVLVVQSVRSPANSGVTVELINHQILRVREVRALSDRLTLTYTISNGTASAEGEVLVLPVPASPTLRPPVAVDDEATVRAGDVVTIDALANDSHPDNATLSLVPDLVEQPDAADGLIFTAQDTVRFRAGPVAKTVYAIYEVTDPQGQRDSAQITIYVRAANAEQNSAPRPRELTARVLAGSTVRIPIPLDGIDPDGDSVTLLGLDRVPDKGRVASFGQGWMEFEANPSATGVDSFSYAVEDTFGARAVGTVLIGIAPPPAVNQAPQAADDVVTVRPDRRVSVAVLANDVDPDGDQLALVTNGLEAAGLKPTVLLDRVLFDSPAEPGVYTIYYTIQDSFGAESMAALAVTVAADAPLRAPIARDDALTLADILGKTAVDVPVLDNDEDPDGAATELDLSSSVETATILSSRQVRVGLTEATQVIPYTITDPDGLSATAFLRVPGISGLRPTLVPGLEEVEVISGETLTVNLADYVVVADGKTARVTEAAKVRALRGTATVVDDDTLTYVSDPKYYGPAALTFEVTDGTSTEDAAGRKAVLTLPIRVLPGANEPPTFAGASVSVVAGESASVDLSSYAVDPDPDDAKNLRYSVTGEQPAGLEVQVEGSTLTVTADTATAKGTVASVALAVTDGVTAAVPGSATIQVVASSRPLAAANDDDVPEAFQGRTAVVSVLANDSNPFDTPLTVVDAQVETGAGTAVVQGSDVAITPADDFVGTMVVRYGVLDATKDPDRQVDGRVRVTVQGRPEAPLTPTVVEVRSKTVVLSWSPPSNNGSVITGYTVRSAQGYSRECAATTCTLEGLTNNVEYVFTVVATNAVGESDASSPSAPARPDAKPDAPQAPTLAFGDQELTVAWSNASYSDRSAIESVTLEISPAPPSGAIQKVGVTGTSLVWTGLQNGVPYRVRIQAVNSAPDPSDWGAYSASEIPAGVPGQPAAPTTQGLAPVGSQAQMQVSWPAAAANGDAISTYTLTVLRGGAALRTIVVPGTQTTQAVLVDASETDYTFTVSAKNKAGTSATSSASAPRRGVLPPGPVKVLSAAPSNNAVQLAFSAADGNGARAGEIRYQYQVNGGGWANLAADKAVRSGVPNNGTYTVGVRAVSNVGGADYVGPGTNANAVAPFGPVGTPTAGATGGTTDVTLSWGPPGRNGRDVQVQISVNGGGWENVAASGSRVVGNGYEQTHSIRVQAVDTEGQTSAPATASARSSNAPAARVYLSKFGDAQGVGNCTDPSCQFVQINWENMPGGSYLITFEDDVSGSFNGKNAASPKTITMSGNGSYQTTAYFGYSGSQIRIKYNGTPSEPLRW